MIPILMTANAIYEYFTNIWLIKAPYNVNAARAAGVTSMSEIDTISPD